jgi:hypothetical protein
LNFSKYQLSLEAANLIRKRLNSRKLRDYSQVSEKAELGTTVMKTKRIRRRKRRKIRVVMKKSKLSRLNLLKAKQLAI